MVNILLFTGFYISNRWLSFEISEASNSVGLVIHGHISQLSSSCLEYVVHLSSVGCDEISFLSENMGVFSMVPQHRFAIESSFQVALSNKSSEPTQIGLLC